MPDEKMILLAEISVLPECLEEVKGIFLRILSSVLHEPCCEAMYTTSIANEPNQLVFFEVFSSEAAHRFHMEQSYTHQLAADLEGKLAGPMKMTRLKMF